jgi:hypothetical protein
MPRRAKGRRGTGKNQSGGQVTPDRRYVLSHAWSNPGLTRSPADKGRGAGPGRANPPFPVFCRHRAIRR